MPRLSRVMRIALLFSAVHVAAPAPAAAQPAAVLLTAPASLAGRWDFNNGQFSDIWSIQIERLHDDGRIEGRMTYWGRRCSARDAPLKEGSWRDGVLRMVVFGGRDCGDMHFELKPGSRRLLEGRAVPEYDRSIHSVVWLDRR